MNLKGGIAQYLVLGLAIVLVVVLYVAPHNPLAKAEAAAEPVIDADYDLSLDLSEARNNLDSVGLARIDAFATKGQLDSVVGLYNMLRQPAAAAYVAAQRAEVSATPANLADAGERYLLCARFIGNDAQRKAWFAKAKELLSKAVEADPSNLDTKVSLGVCLVEGATLTGEPPMQGIGVLKEVEQANPDHAGALLNLGYFSIRSGQYDKAEERFNRVVQKHPEMAEAHLYLADLHERTEKFEAAITDLNNYLKLINDPQKTAEVNEYINSLRTKLKK